MPRASETLLCFSCRISMQRGNTYPESFNWIYYNEMGIILCCYLNNLGGDGADLPKNVYNETPLQGRTEKLLPLLAV
jgi:hypothetical protein